MSLDNSPTYLQFAHNMHQWRIANVISANNSENTISKFRYN